MNYPTIEKQILALVFSLVKFRSYLVGSLIVVFTYRLALKYLIAKKDAKPRLITCVLLLQEFELEIKNKEGVENIVADHLSQLTLRKNER